MMKEIQLKLTETNTVDVTREIHLHTPGKQQGFNDQQVDRSQLDAIAGAP